MSAMPSVTGGCQRSAKENVLLRKEGFSAWSRLWSTMVEPMMTERTASRTQSLRMGVELLAAHYLTVEAVGVDFGVR